jgi:phosphoglycolate phosphatase
VDVEAFKGVYGMLLAEYIRNGRYDSIPQANYDALDRLLEMRKLLMVLTSRTHGELKHMLEPDYLLATRMKAFYYKDNTQFHKPDPRVFDELLVAHGFDPADCVYVGDSVSDAVATKQARLHFIASLESGLRQKVDFNGYEVDRFITKFPEIVDAVTSIDS